MFRGHSPSPEGSAVLGRGFIAHSPAHQLKHCKLPQRGPGRSPGDQRIW